MTEGRGYLNSQKDINEWLQIHYIRTKTQELQHGIIHTQIDNILTPQRFKSSIIRSATRTYPGADLNSDHDIVVCNLRLKLRSTRSTSVIDQHESDSILID